MNRRKDFPAILSLLLAFFLLAPLIIHPFLSPVCGNSKKDGFNRASASPAGANIQISFEEKEKEEKSTHQSTHRSTKHHPVAVRMLFRNTDALRYAKDGGSYSLANTPIYRLTRVILI